MALNPKQWKRIVTQTTVVIHNRACFLGSVVLNTHAASAVLTLYNNGAGSGDIIAIIDCATAGRAPLRYDIGLASGLTAVMSGGNADVTITSEGPNT